MTWLKVKEQAKIAARSFLDEMKRNPLAMATTGAFISAAGMAAFQLYFTGTFDWLTLSKAVGFGFVGTSAGVLLYDWAYDKGIMKEFLAAHREQAMVFETINFLLISWGIALAAGVIPNTPEAAKTVLSYINTLKDQLLALPIKAEDAEQIKKVLEGLTDERVLESLVI